MDKIKQNVENLIGTLEIMIPHIKEQGGEDLVNDLTKVFEVELSIKSFVDMFSLEKYCKFTDKLSAEDSGVKIGMILLLLSRE